MARRGHVLANLARYSEAVISYDKAIAVNPDFADAWYNRGIALKKGREFNCLKRLKNVKSIATDFFYSTRKAWFLEWLLVFWLKRSILDNPSNYLKINPRRISPFFLSYGSNNFFVDEK